MSQPDPDPQLEPEKQSTQDPTSITPSPKSPDASKKPGRFDKTFESEEKPVHALVDMSTIQLKAEDLYDKDKVDLEQVELDDVWALLQYVSVTISQVVHIDDSLVHRHFC
jgi:H+-transporting ATPase